MKEIILIRHAKSEWGSETRDIDRPLSERGFNDAYMMSDWYMKNKELPALYVTSPATRALSTALIFLRTMGSELNQLKIDKRIYEASTARLLSVIRSINPPVNRVMLFGHNPSFTVLCNELSPALYFDNLPTCGMVSFISEIRSWKEFGAGKVSLNYYQYAKDFRNKS